MRSRRARERDLGGGLIAGGVAVGEQLVRIATVVYFAPRLGRSEETDRPRGTAATMLVWLYVLSRLITGAAFPNAVLWRRRRAGT